MHKNSREIRLSKNMHNNKRTVGKSFPCGNCVVTRYANEKVLLQIIFLSLKNSCVAPQNSSNKIVQGMRSHCRDNARGINSSQAIGKADKCRPGTIHSRQGMNFKQSFNLMNYQHMNVNKTELTQSTRWRKNISGHSLSEDIRKLHQLPMHFSNRDRRLVALPHEKAAPESVPVLVNHLVFPQFNN